MRKKGQATKSLRRAYVTAGEVLKLLEHIEHYRHELSIASAILEDWLRGSPELKTEWLKFVSAGGVTAADFDRFLGGTLHPRPTLQKAHLRLLA